MDDGQATDAPTHAEEAIATLAAVGERKTRCQTVYAGRHGDRDRIGRRTISNVKAAGRGADRSRDRLCRSQRQTGGHTQDNRGCDGHKPHVGIQGVGVVPRWVRGKMRLLRTADGLLPPRRHGILPMVWSILIVI